MTRKEKRDRKNANHRRNEQRKWDRRIEAMFRPFAQMLAESRQQMEIMEATDAAWKLAYESRAFGLK